MKPDADRRSPAWSEPLAPLADWLRSVDDVIERARRPRPHPRVVTPPTRRPPDRTPPAFAMFRKDFMRHWRARHRLDAREAARWLGYRHPSEILRIEAGKRVPRNLRRQQERVEEQAPDAARDRSAWLFQWRKRMGISGRIAAQRLGYRHRNDYYRAEKGFFQPSWEKVLVALFEEERAGEPAVDATSLGAAARDDRPADEVGGGGGQSQEARVPEAARLPSVVGCV